MGASYMDYIVASGGDPRTTFRLLQREGRKLPNCYQPNNDKRAIAEGAPSRRELGLPERGFVFCCFNNTFKITPDVFGLWMRLLTEVEDSTLWLLEDHPAVPVNLAREAQRHGIHPARLIFAPSLPLAEHLARLRRADLFLDTFYYNAHSTASDALWAGLPLITWQGERFAARVAASLLRAVGLPQLIAATHDDYFALARRLTAPLSDTAGFTRDLEALYCSSGSAIAKVSRRITSTCEKRSCSGARPYDSHGFGSVQ